MPDEDRFNILYHFRVRGTGAEGVHIAGIVNGFRAMGHTVCLLSPTNADPTVESPPAAAYKISASVKTTILHKLADLLPQPFFELMEVSYNLYAIFRLWKATSSNNVDFIYERYAFFNLAGAFVARRKKIPLIIEVNELSGHRRIRAQFLVRLCAVLERYVLRQAAVVVTVSDFLNHEVCKTIEPNKATVVTIPNGVPQKWLQQTISLDKVASLRGKHNLEKKKIICFVGGLVHWHNFGLLLEAVKEVQNSMAEAVLLFIGTGPLKKHIQDIALELDFLPNSVVFVGNVPHSEIPTYLTLADVAVIPETNDFRSPIKMFEYMAMGLPVVAPEKPAIEVAITHNENGLLFEPGNASSLAQMLKKCLSESHLAISLGENARRKVVENFTWEGHAERILHTLSQKC